MMNLCLGKISQNNAYTSHYLLNVAIIQALIGIPFFYFPSQLQKNGICSLGFSHIRNQYGVVANLRHTVVVGGQLIFLQKINALFHIQLSKIEPSRLMVQCPKVCMEICGQMSIPGMNLTKHAKCFLHQSNRLLRILFQRCSAVQQTSPVRSCSHSLIGQDCSQLVYDRLHPRFIAVLIHVLKYILIEEKV